MRPDRVVFEASDARGGGRVRSEWPAAALKRTGWNATTTTGWAKVRPGDVVVIHRPLTPDWLLGSPLAPLQCLRRYQAAGATVLIDRDDEIERIPAWSTKAAERAQIAAHRAEIEEADGLIVTTRRLEELYDPLAKRVWRVPNHLPAWAGDIQPDLPPGDRVRVGWAGQLKSHRGDIEWFAPVARTALEGAEFVTVGSTDVPTVLGLDPAACIVEKPEWDIAAFYRKMARADIGIVPLDNGTDREWNTSKSDLKAREFIALGKPVVVTDLPEQRALIESTGAGLIAGTPQEFAEAVQRLVWDWDLRAEMTAKALAAGRGLSLEANLDVWTEPLEEVTAWLSSRR